MYGDVGHGGLRRSVARGVAWGQAGRILETALSLLFALLVVRQLGLADFGAYSVVVSILAFANLGSALGLNEALARFIPAALAAGDGPGATALARALVALRSLAAVLLAVVFLVLAGPARALATVVPLADFVVWLVAGLIVLNGLQETLYAAMFAHHWWARGAVGRIGGQALTLSLALMLFLLHGPSVQNALLALGGGQVLSCLIFLASWWRGSRSLARPGAIVTVDGDGVWPGKPRPLANVLTFAWPVWLAQLLTFSLSLQVDTLVIAALLHDYTEVGRYALAALVLYRVSTLLSGWGVVLVPSLSHLHRLDGLAGVRHAFRVYSHLNLGLLLPSFAYLAVTAPFVIPTVFGSAYRESVLLVQVFCIAYAASALLGSGVALPTLYVVDRQRSILGLRIIWGIANLALDVLLIPGLGALGAVLATVVAKLGTHATELLVARRARAVSYPGGFASKLTLSVGVATAAALIIGVAGPLAFLASSLLFAGLAGGLLVLLRPLATEDQQAIVRVEPRLSRAVQYLGRGGS